jgi:arylsulfatase
MKRTFAVLLVVSLSCFANADQPPNFVLFIADDISSEDLGCYGHPSIKTPNIDNLAAQGMRFDNAYLTISSCSPSRCSIISGRYPHNHGAPELNIDLPPDQPKFPKVLRVAGYYTLLSGKHHMGDDANDAFETISEGVGLGKEEDWVECIQKRPKDKPFFIWLASSDAHTPHRINDDAPVYDPADVVVPPYMYDAPGIRKKLAAYYHEVSRFDAYVGEVVAELETQDVLDNTLIIVIADNGRPFVRAKTRLYDSGIKTPLLVCYPRLIKPGLISQSLVSSIDISATILELAGQKKKPRMQGISFAPILADPKATIRDVVFAEHNWHVTQAHERMVRAGDYLYIKNNFPNHLFREGRDKELIKAHEEGQLTPAQANIFCSPRPAEELFKVSNDPHQLIDLAGNPEYHATLEKLRRLLTLWTEQTGDTIPEDPTPDTPKGTKIRNAPHREMPGAAMGAEKNNHPGPVKL